MGSRNIAVLNTIEHNHNREVQLKELGKLKYIRLDAGLPASDKK